MGFYSGCCSRRERGATHFPSSHHHESSQALFDSPRLIYNAWWIWTEAGYLADLVDNIRVQILEQASTRKAQSNARRTYHEPLCYLVPYCGPTSPCIEASWTLGPIGLDLNQPPRTVLRCTLAPPRPNRPHDFLF